MKTRLVLLLAFALFAPSRDTRAADLITRTIVITNAPVGNSNSITISASARSFTNQVTASPATLIQETNSIPWSASNIVGQLSFYPVSGAHRFGVGTNFVRVTGGVGENLSLTINSCCWGYVTNSTQSVASPTFTVRVPITVEASSNQVSIASLLVQGQSTSSTQAFATNSTALSNFITKGASPGQHVAAPITFTGGFSGVMEKITNGYGTNTVLDAPRTTNLVNHGNAISSLSTASGEQFGAGANAAQSSALAVGFTAAALNLFTTSVGYGAVASNVQDSAFGYSALADGQFSLAIGSGAKATNGSATAVGNAALAYGNSSVALGKGASVGDDAQYGIAIGSGPTGARATNGNGIAIGAVSVAGHTNTLAIGRSARATHSNSIVIANFTQSTMADEITLGATNHVARIPGRLQVENGITNTTFTGTNILNGRIAYPSRANSSPVNGDNSGVLLGTNVVISITGPTTIGAYAGFAAAPGDTYHFIRFSGAITNLLRNQSGLEATAANRIITGTGADISLTNEPSWAQVIYNGASSRWEVIAHSR